MNLTLKSALIELRSDGVNLDPIADLENILTLDKLSRRISEPFRAGSDAPILEPELSIGNIVIRRLSLGAQCFLADVVASWIPDDAEMQDLAYIYCMTHAPETLWPLQHNRSAFLRAVKDWTKTVGVTPQTLCMTVKRFLASAPEGDQAVSERTITSGACRGAMNLLTQLRPIPEAYRIECQAALIALECEESDGGHGYGPLVEMLIREYGHDADHWLWRVSADEIGIMIAARNEKMEVEARSIKGARDDRMLRAHHAFVEYVELVRRLKKGLKP